VEHAVAFVADTSWGETTITWNNRPPSDHIFSQRMALAAYQPVSFNVTPFVQSALLGSNLLSLRVWSVKSIGDGYVDYGSSRANASFRPVLEIILSNGPGPAGQNVSLAVTSAQGRPAALIPDAVPNFAWDDEISTVDQAMATQAVPVSTGVSNSTDRLMVVAPSDPDTGVGIVPAIPDPLSLS
jgi:hypothetical protein